jgi:hypothetical protein
MAPRDDVEVSKPNTADVLAQILAGAVRPSKMCTPKASQSPLDAVRLPSIKIRDYARRLEQYCRCSEECYILSLVYIERALERNPSLSITDLNVHRLLLAATVVAAKIQDDDYYSNDYYAKVGGVNTQELMSLEAYMLSLLGWRAHVSVDEYNSSLQRLEGGQVSLLHPVRKAEACSAISKCLDETSKANACEEATPKKVGRAAEVLIDDAATTPEKTQLRVAQAADQAIVQIVVVDKNPNTCEWNIQRRITRKRSATPGYLNARRNRVCVKH